jgi:hypothetical protein
MDEKRALQARRHDDNAAAWRELSAKLDQHAWSVEMICPRVAALELSRSKIAIWASIGFAVAVLAGWVVEAVVKWAVGWVLSHFQLLGTIQTLRRGDCQKKSILFESKDYYGGLLTFPSDAVDDFLSESLRQIAASGARPVVWIFADREDAVRTQKLFKDAGEGREYITIVHVPWTTRGTQWMSRSTATSFALAGRGAWNLLPPSARNS